MSVMVALTSASISSTGPGMGSCWHRCSALRICCRFCQMISASFSHLQGAQGLQRDSGFCSSPGQGRKMQDPLPPSLPPSQQSTPQKGAGLGHSCPAQAQSRVPLSKSRRLSGWPQIGTNQLKSSPAHSETPLSLGGGDTGLRSQVPSGAKQDTAKVRAATDSGNLLLTPTQGQKRQLASSLELPIPPTSHPHQDCSTSRLPSGGPPLPASCCRRFHWISSSSRMMVCCFRSSCRVFWCFSASSCVRAQQLAGSRGAVLRAWPRTQGLALSHPLHLRAPQGRGALLSQALSPTWCPESQVTELPPGKGTQGQLTTRYCCSVCASRCSQVSRDTCFCWRAVSLLMRSWGFSWASWAN